MSYVKNSTGGKILAVTQAIIDRVDSQSVSSGGTWNPTIPNVGSAGQYFGLTVSPIRADSKILFQGFVMASCPDAGTIMMILRKDGSDITEALGTNVSSRRPCHSAGYTPSGTTASCVSLPINYLMPLSSATPFEFHIELAHESGSTRTMYINRSSGDTNNNQFGRYVSVFTATEFLS